MSRRDKNTVLPTRVEVPAKPLLLWAPVRTAGRKGTISYVVNGSKTDPLALARAVSVSRVWRETPDAILIVRPGPRPALGVVGHFEAKDEVRLAAYTEELNLTLPHVRYIDHARVQEDCERLGAQLVERFGRAQLGRSCFVAMPRGGLIVLGLLAYVLGLSRTQLEAPPSPDAPLIVVDDCALTGSRFGRFLSRCESQRVVFAHLYSHPYLRAAIETRESSVIACLGARDLTDYAPESLGNEYANWRDLWVSRADEHHYWIGQPEHVCFPWNEPDRAVWDPFTGRVERGWPVIPPDLCLKNRPAPGVKPAAVQVQPEGQGPLRPSVHVLFGEFEGQLVVGNFETRDSFNLDGVAADMWRAVVRHGNVREAAVSLSERYEVASTVLEADLKKFVEELLARNLLEHTGTVAHDS